MQNPRLAARYAKSLLDLAVEQNSLDATLQDMTGVHQVCRSSREFTSVLRSPVIKGDKKTAIVDAVLGARLGILSKAFINLLIAKGREGVLPEIASAFLEQYKTLKNIRTATLTTAMPATESLKASVRAKVEAAVPGQSVELNTVVDPSIIGGFVLEIGDRIVDASVRRDLADVRKNFTGNLYVSQLA
jgi:F-type H+-transporting ATPase subunit delta